MNDYPRMISEKNLIQPVPRRIRGYFAGQLMFDTTRAIYVWEWSPYPQYYIPIEDVNDDLLVDEVRESHETRGTYMRLGFTVGEREHPAAAKKYTDDSLEGLSGMVRFEWDALDSWFEEDEQIFVHPRNPYTRVDAIRSTRTVRVELDGEVLAESSSPVMVFETGLPTRYYLNRTDVNFEHLIPNDTVTECPYKGTTTDYWSVNVGGTVHADLAWSYSFPTRQLLPIAGLVAFYNEKVDIFIDDVELPRAKTHFFPTKSAT
ncbi:hypothetical protein A20C1_10925 [marine actinobacterium PHSC20C1]|nr:hypothetical protein A20C1_10925 [marine actinobacterium PHSC20C1]